jgi:hypothetical protein
MAEDLRRPHPGQIWRCLRHRVGTSSYAPVVLAPFPIGFVEFRASPPVRIDRENFGEVLRQTCPRDRLEAEPGGDRRRFTEVRIDSESEELSHLPSRPLEHPSRAPRRKEGGQSAKPQDRPGRVPAAISSSACRRPLANRNRTDRPPVHAGGTRPVPPPGLH